MYLRKWNETLVDWVNCLALTDRIKDLQELEDGHFFRLLLKNLALPDGFTDSDLSPDGFTAVSNLLEKEFPHYGLCEIKREVDTKLSYISSLLLLLSVTKGETPMFRSYLCENLQHDSQVQIKCFLECCIERADQLDHKYLKSIIDGDFVSSEINSPPRQPKEFVVAKTPMKMFFDSPRQTDKLRRDLRRLEAENEALQIEKMELEDELRIEKEKRDQIEGDLQMKTKQVVKLREELQEFTQNLEAQKIYGIECNCHKIQSLQTEVKELESCINAMTEEKSIINNDKVKLQEKLSVFQSKNKELETRELYYDCNIEELQMMLNKKDQELHALKEQCAELEDKICALPVQHNTSIESDISLSLGCIISSPFSEGECLSHAVVDVKLAEVEEENEKLKDQIKGIMDQRENLTDQLREVKDKLENTRVAQKAAAAENVKIQDKLIEYTNEREQLNIALSEAMLKISKQQDLITFTNKEATDLSRKLNVAVELNSHLEFESKSLKEDVREKQARLDEMNIQLDLITSEKTLYEKQLLGAGDKVKNMEIQLNDFGVRIKDLTEKLTDKNYLIEKTSQTLKDCEENLEMMKKEKESAVKNIDMKEEELKKLKDQINEEQDIIQSLKSNQEVILVKQTQEKQKLEAYIESIKSDMKQLEEEKLNYIQEKTVYERKLLDAGDKINIMETKLIELERKIEQLTEQLNEKNFLVDKTLKERNASANQLELMRSKENLAVENIVMKEKELKKLEDQLNEEKIIICSLKSDRESLISEKKQVLAMLYGLRTTIDMLQQQQNIYNEERLSMEFELSHWKSEVKNLEKKMEELKVQNCSTCSKKIIRFQGGAELHGKYLEKSHIVKKNGLSPGLRRICLNNVVHLNDGSMQFISSEEKCVHSEGINSEKTSEKDAETLKKALDEMEIAKRDMERISKETRQELEKSQREKEILVQKVDFLNTLNIKLENKLELSEEKVERVKQETLEKVQKILEEKLVKAKEKLKSHYMEDVMKFNEEIQLCKQFEEGYKKYRSLAVDCEKRLSDATAQINDLLNKVEILKKQKSLLEEKLRLSKLELGRGDAQRESMNPDIYKKHSVERIANYFSEGKLAGSSHVKFQSERRLKPENLSSSFSREVVQDNIPSGQIFGAKDEERELFNATHLADLKAGKCILPSNVTYKKRDTLGDLNDNIKQNHDKATGFSMNNETPTKRFAELIRRNTLCLPHLKSSYATETQFHDPKSFSGEIPKDRKEFILALEYIFLSSLGPRRSEFYAALWVIWKAMDLNGINIDWFFKDYSTSLMVCNYMYCLYFLYFLHIKFKYFVYFLMSGMDL